MVKFLLMFVELVELVLELGGLGMDYEMVRFHYECVAHVVVMKLGHKKKVVKVSEFRYVTEG